MQVSCKDPFSTSKQNMSHICLWYSIIINSHSNQSIVDERKTNKRFFFFCFPEVRDNHLLWLSFFCSIIMSKTKCVNKQHDANIDILSLVSVFFLLLFFNITHTHTHTPEKRRSCCFTHIYAFSDSSCIQLIDKYNIHLYISI